ncbi:hypothetical protein CLOM_g12405 [Closterium sp. NIES-68]|nr:hypothetical protein CLOM_g12405 [Closterium sp. NIES-68]GJP77529.1 hypothetical protein CLOP_g7907 [Closterium sp. NIES-67]
MQPTTRLRTGPGRGAITLAHLCAVVLALTATLPAMLPVVPLAGAQPMAGPRCVNRFPQKPLCKFVDDLAGAPLTFLDASAGKTIEIGAYDVYQKFHRDLPDTKVYAYGVSRSSARYPGPVLVAKRGTTTKVKFSNHIEDKQHMFTVDPTLMAPKLKNGGVPISVHLHGAETPSKFDGHPMAWHTAFGEQGPEFESQEHQYPNEQRATMLWYHDHTVGMTAINVAAGMAGLYVIRDPQGEERRLKKWLPRGARQLHLLIADRMFFPNGSMNYPNVGSVPNVHPNWTPGLRGDTIVVNGKVWPYLKVRRAQHRLRMVNAGNARTYNLSFQCAARGDYNFNPPLGGPVVPFYLIGSDGGYLAHPLRRTSILFAPGVRHDMLLDFNAAPAWCRDVILVNSAPQPFPVGLNADWFTGVVMRFRINERRPMAAPALPKRLSYIPAVDVSQAVKQRWLEITIIVDPVVNKTITMLFNNKAYMDPATETPKVGTSEIWHIINPTFETHPIHLHLVQHRPISRRPINSGGLINGSCSLDPSSSKPSCFTGPARPVPRHEQGWKDTTVAFNDMVTTIFVPFKGQDGKAFPFDATEGPGYVWHCHSLGHEDNEMMRPLIMTS